MARAGVEVEGARRLRATLKAAGDDLAELKDANAKVARLVTTRAQSKAPHRSGRLAGSGRGSRAAASAVVRFGGASVPYAGPVHWGWPGRNIEPQTFAADALTETQPEWLDEYLAGLDRILAQVKGA